MHGSEEGPGGRLNGTGIVTANDEGTGPLKDIEAGYMFSTRFPYDRFHMKFLLVTFFLLL